MASIRTVFFDFGNVIAFFDHGRAVERLSAHTELDQAALYTTLYRHPRFNALESGQVSGERYVREVMDEARLRCTPEYFRSAFADIFTPNSDVCNLIPRIAATHQLVLASNTNELHAELFLRTYNEVLGCFDQLVLSHQAKTRKPDQEFYAHCQGWARATVEECLFVDDRIDNIEAATRHGWKTIRYSDFKSLQRGLRDLQVCDDV